MSDFDDLIADCNAVCLDVLGDKEGTLTDSVIPAAPIAGFFREDFTQEMSEQYGFTASAPTFECRLADIAGLDRSKLKQWKYRPADRSFDYKVVDLHGPTKGMVLLVLAA